MKLNRFYRDTLHAGAEQIEQLRATIAAQSAVIAMAREALRNANSIIPCAMYQEALDAIAALPQSLGRHCEYNGGTCTRDGCKHGCQAEKLRQGSALPTVKERLTVQDAWLPVETAPKDGTRILLLSERYGVREARFYRDNLEGTDFYDVMIGGGPLTIFYDATHWQPLPPAPQTKGEV